MEIITLNDKEKLKEYDEFVNSNPKGHFLQSYKWANVKNNWKWRGIISRDSDGKICGTMSVLLRKIPLFGSHLMYSPRGMVCDISNIHILEDLMNGAKKLASEFNVYEFKIDPDVKTGNEKFEKSMQMLGFVPKPKTKNFEEIQPRFVFRLDVKDKTEDELMNIFSSKTRYNIRLAARKGVEVKLCDKSKLDEFHPIMATTGTRDDFAVRPKEYFDRLLTSLGDDARLYMAYYENKPIAGTIAIRFANKVWYLYGASANEYRNVMPNYLLQWEMIKWAVESKSEIYDFRGVSGDMSEDNPLYGLYRFKRGFNGELCEFTGEMDYVFNPSKKRLIEAAEKSYKSLNRFKNQILKK